MGRLRCHLRSVVTVHVEVLPPLLLYEACRPLFRVYFPVIVFVTRFELLYEQVLEGLPLCGVHGPTAVGVRDALDIFQLCLEHALATERVFEQSILQHTTRLVARQIRT